MMPPASLCPCSRGLAAPLQWASTRETEPPRPVSLTTELPHHIPTSPAEPRRMSATPRVQQLAQLTFKLLPPSLLSLCFSFEPKPSAEHTFRHCRLPSQFELNFATFSNSSC